MSKKAWIVVIVILGALTLGGTSLVLSSYDGKSYSPTYGGY